MILAFFQFRLRSSTARVGACLIVATLFATVAVWLSHGCFTELTIRRLDRVERLVGLTTDGTTGADQTAAAFIRDVYSLPPVDSSQLAFARGHVHRTAGIPYMAIRDATTGELVSMPLRFLQRGALTLLVLLMFVAAGSGLAVVVLARGKEQYTRAIRVLCLQGTRIATIAAVAGLSVLPFVSAFIWYVRYDRTQRVRGLLYYMVPPTGEEAMIMAIAGSASFVLAYVLAFSVTSESLVCFRKRCLRCHYALQGLNAPLCPECGTATDVGWWQARGRRTTFRATAALALIASLLAGGVLAVVSRNLSGWRERVHAWLELREPIIADQRYISGRPGDTFILQLPDGVAALQLRYATPPPASDDNQTMIPPVELLWATMFWSGASRPGAVERAEVRTGSVSLQINDQYSGLPVVGNSLAVGRYPPPGGSVVNAPGVSRTGSPGSSMYVIQAGDHIFLATRYDWTNAWGLKRLLIPLDIQLLNLSRLDDSSDDPIAQTLRHAASAADNK